MESSTSAPPNSPILTRPMSTMSSFSQGALDNALKNLSDEKKRYEAREAAKKLPPRGINYRNAIRRYTNIIQRELQDEVAKEQKEPDKELDAAIAAFGPSSNPTPSTSVTTTATPSQPVPKATSVRPGAYNVFGEFVMASNPQRSRASTLSECNHQRMFTASLRSQFPPVNGSHKVKKKSSGKGKKIVAAKAAEVDKFFARLEPDGYSTKLKYMRADLSLQPIDLSEHTDEQLVKEIRELHPAWYVWNGKQRAEKKDRIKARRASRLASSTLQGGTETPAPGPSRIVRLPVSTTAHPISGGVGVSTQGTQTDVDHQKSSYEMDIAEYGPGRSNCEEDLPFRG